jgi:hypothetical protein
MIEVSNFLDKKKKEGFTVDMDNLNDIYMDYLCNDVIFIYESLGLDRDINAKI